jgi:hypothetical protein
MVALVFDENLSISRNHVNDERTDEGKDRQLHFKTTYRFS